MAWYSTGSVSVTNGNATVNGLGTSWFGGLQAGWGFVGPDGRAYEIQEITDATTMVLATTYQGSTASGQSYACFPTMSLANDLSTAFQAILTEYQGYVDTSLVGKFLAGTSGAPGISFEIDPDTGMRRVDSNDIAIVSGGQDRLRLNASGASGDAVQSSADDATAGKLLLPGAGGLLGAGLQPPNDDVNDIENSCFFVAGSSALNKPSFSSNVIGWHGRRTADIHAQFVISRAVASLGRAALRANDGAGWSTWWEVFTQGSILGTVAKTGALPSGALIEYDTAPTGDYFRLADGLQICQQSLSASLQPNIASGNIYRSDEYNWTLPVAFSSSNFWAGASLRSASTVWSAGRVTGSASAAIRAMSATSLGASLTADMIAIGRWD